MTGHMVHQRPCRGPDSSWGLSPLVRKPRRRTCGFLSPSLRTLVASSVLDDDGPPAASLLLGLGHALASFVVRVIRGVDRHLLLNHAEAGQFLGSTDGGGGGGGGQGGGGRRRKRRNGGGLPL